MIMHADLVDQQDFGDRLRALGLTLPDEVSCDEAARRAADGARRGEIRGLATLTRDLLARSELLHPEVFSAIDAHLRAFGEDADD